MMDCTYDGLEARISILKSAAFVLEQEVERLEKMRDIVKASMRDTIEAEGSEEE